MLRIQRIQNIQKNTGGGALDDINPKVGDPCNKVQSQVVGGAIVEYLSEDYKKLFQDVFDSSKRQVWYCDPPYYGTSSKGYSKENVDRGIVFDHERFWAFCEELAERDAEVWISERWMPEERFVPIIEMNKRNLFSKGGGDGPNKYQVEALYVPRANYEKNKQEYIARAFNLLKKGSNFKAVSLSSYLRSAVNSYLF